jgi:hypothetical protein
MEQAVHLLMVKCKNTLLRCACGGGGGGGRVFTEKGTCSTRQVYQMCEAGGNMKHTVTCSW